MGADVTIAPREGWSWTNLLGPVMVSVLGVAGRWCRSFGNHGGVPRVPD